MDSEGETGGPAPTGNPQVGIGLLINTGMDPLE